jgi:pimeloyl-ACP methyl ester carboxylesterase
MLRAFGPLFGQVRPGAGVGDGPGEPWVIALHGWGRRGSDFDRVLDGVGSVAFDLPGFGSSPPPEAAVGAPWYADRVIEALEGARGPFVLVGHSFGGRVAVVAAARRPELVKGLVLTGAPLVRLRPPRKPRLGYRMIRWAARMRLISEQRLERERRRRGSADYRAAQGVMRDVLVTVIGESYEAEMSAIRCPVRLVWGANDIEVPPEVARRAAAILSAGGCDVEIEILDGVGHLTPLEAPDRLRAAIEALR